MTTAQRTNYTNARKAVMAILVDIYGPANVIYNGAGAMSMAVRVPGTFVTVKVITGQGPMTVEIYRPNHVKRVQPLLVADYPPCAVDYRLDRSALQDNVNYIGETWVKYVSK